MTKDLTSKEIGELAQTELLEKIKDEIYAYHHIKNDTFSCIKEKAIELGVAEKEIYFLPFNYKYVITDKDYVISRQTAQLKVLSDESDTNEENDIFWCPQFRLLKKTTRYRLFIPLKAQNELKTKGYKLRALYKTTDRYLTKAQVDELSYIEKRNAFSGYYVDIHVNNLIEAAIIGELPINKGRTNEHSKKQVIILVPSGKMLHYESMTEAYKKYFKKLCSKSTFEKAIAHNNDGTFIIKRKTYKIIK